MTSLISFGAIKLESSEQVPLFNRHSLSGFYERRLASGKAQHWERAHFSAICEVLSFLAKHGRLQSAGVWMFQEVPDSFAAHRAYSGVS
jgi:hypothetical protein